MSSIPTDSDAPPPVEEHVPRQTAPIWPALIAIAVVSLIYTVVFWQQRDMLLGGASDFSFLYAAGTIVDSGHGDLVYDYDTQRRAQQPFIGKISFRKGPLLYNHAPFELLLYVPLGLLSYEHAVVLWYALNVCGLFVVPALLRKRLPWIRNELVYALILPAFFLPVTAAITQGQDSIVLLLLFTLFFLNFNEGKQGIAGSILALAAFKPHLVLPMLLVMLVTRKWKVVLGFTATGFALAGVSCLMVGWRATVHFPAYLAAFNRLPADVAAAYPEKMANIRGFIYSLLNSRLPSQTTQLIGLLLSAAVVVLLLVFYWRRRELSLLDLSLVLTVSLLASYHVNLHDLAVLILPFYVVADRLSRGPFTWGRIAIVLGVLAMFLSPLAGASALAMCPALALFAGALFFEAYQGDRCLTTNASVAAGD